MLKSIGRSLESYQQFKTEDEAKNFQEFYFIQAADTQLGLMYNFGTNGEDGVKYPDSNWDQEMELCRKSVDILNNLSPPPAFFIVCGDLVDAFGDKYPDIREAQEKDLKRVYADLSPNIPMICVCGNHDVGNSPTQASIDKYKNSFGDDYFVFYKNGCCFLVLNSQFYEDSSNVPELYVEHESWLEKCLLEAQTRKVHHIVIFQHIPWFVKSPDEEKIYFNIEKDLRLRKLEQFWKAGVKKIFCGHYHRNAGGWYKDVELVVTSAIGCQIGPDTHGMRIVRVKRDVIDHEYHSLDNFPSAIDL